MNVQMDKHLETKSWLFVKDLIFEACPANVHALPIFLYFLSVLYMYLTSTQYALHYHRERINIALKRGILH